jgi:hypothetical protein
MVWSKSSLIMWSGCRYNQVSIVIVKWVYKVALPHHLAFTGHQEISIKTYEIWINISIYVLWISIKTYEIWINISIYVLWISIKTYEIWIKISIYVLQMSIKTYEIWINIWIYVLLMSIKTYEIWIKISKFSKLLNNFMDYWVLNHNLKVKNHLWKLTTTLQLHNV